MIAINKLFKKLQRDFKLKIASLFCNTNHSTKAKLKNIKITFIENYLLKIFYCEISFLITYQIL